MSVPIGIRQNNPGNLECGQPWQGLAPKQPGDRFCRFVLPLYGIRAMALVVRNYGRRGKAKTVRQVLDIYAPASENNVRAYVRSVCQRSGLPPDSPVNLNAAETLEKLIPAMIHHENGMQPYPPELIAGAVKLAMEAK